MKCRLGRLLAFAATSAALILAGCKSDGGTASATAKAPKAKRAYSRPVFQTGSLIPVNRGNSAAGDVRTYSNTNKAPVQYDTQRFSSGAPAAGRGN
jgi:hypothetical protein